MRREPPITFGGALKVLGHYERPLVDKIDRLLGGVILGAGAAAVAGVAPAAALLTLWGSADQKNEATGLLRKCLDWAESRVSSLRGYERLELVAAAHTILVVSAFFEVLHESSGGRKARVGAVGMDVLITGRSRTREDSLADFLVAAEVPMPGGARGFVENSVLVGAWLEVLSQRAVTFVRAELAPEKLAAIATKRYQSGYLRMAATIPDFLVWASLGEHAATRRTVEATGAGIESALTGSTAALNRVYTLLGAMTSAAAQPTGSLAALARANGSVLGLPVVWSDDGTTTAVTFPKVADGYVNPSYRLAVAERTSRPADESWWTKQALRTDIDLMIAGHVTAVDATRRPMLLLGHPGSGKSMLTKVLAARLPFGSYTVVRVSLRQVGANDPIHRQIGQALESTTQGRIRDWAAVADASADKVRIVLLDGLDELLQATSNDRSGYLRDVIEFQRFEAAQERPVMVVVTSRTVVADRVEIPLETPIVKLEEFDDAQVGRWLDAWNRANAGGIATGSVRALEPEDALAREQLARQPLLLLMLAIYVADPEQPLGTGLSLTELYRQLLRSFAEREVRKRAGRPVHGAPLEQAVADQLHRLSVAAIGMFNRGRQDITEPELGADLNGLSGDELDAESVGRRVLGEFFFVHAAEARIRADRGEARRCYEFLHATFGEYLIAALVTEELADVADAAFGGARGRREPVDDLLFALLSHQSMASRRPILEFAGELFRAAGAEERVQIGRTLEILIQRYDRRADAARYRRYRPTGPNHVRHLAAYSANLVLLRAAVDDGVSVAALAPDHEDPVGRWRSIVTLWRAGLAVDDWQATLGALVLTKGIVRFLENAEDAFPADFADIAFARLLADRDSESRLRIGAAMQNRLIYHIEGDDWAEAMVSWLLPTVIFRWEEPPGYFLKDPPADTPPSSIEYILALVSEALVSHASQWSGDFLLKLMSWVDRVAGLDRLSYSALVAAVTAGPSLLQDLPSTANPELYQNENAALAVMAGAALGDVADGRRWRQFATAVLKGRDDIPSETAMAIRRATAPLRSRGPRHPTNSG